MKTAYQISESNALRFAGDSLGFLNRRSQVRILSGPPNLLSNVQTVAAATLEPVATFANLGLVCAFLFSAILLCSPAFAGELPDAPSLKLRPARVVHVDGPFVGENAIVHNGQSFAPKEPRNIDWQFLTAHSVYAGALAFDLYLTKQGVSRGCQEANGALGPYPSTGRIVGYGIAEFAVITALDYALARIGQHVGAPRWLRGPMGMMGASIGTVKHVGGGRQWLQSGCL